MAILENVDEMIDDETRTKILTIFGVHVFDDYVESDE